MNNTEYRVTKLEKGKFAVEYRTSTWGAWHEVKKLFKSITKANEYIALSKTKQL